MGRTRIKRVFYGFYRTWPNNFNSTFKENCPRLLDHRGGGRCSDTVLYGFSTRAKYETVSVRVDGGHDRLNHRNLEPFSNSRKESNFDSFGVETYSWVLSRPINFLSNWVEAQREAEFVGCTMFCLFCHWNCGLSPVSLSVFFNGLRWNRKGIKGSLWISY